MLADLDLSSVWCSRGQLSSAERGRVRLRPVTVVTAIVVLRCVVVWRYVAVETVLKDGSLGHLVVD